MQITRENKKTFTLAVSIAMIATTLFILRAPEELLAQSTVSFVTETFYLVDSESSAILSDEGELIGNVAVLPNADLFRYEIDGLYKNIFLKTMEVSSDIRIASRTREQKYYQRSTAGAKRFAPTVDFSIAQKHLYNDDDQSINETDFVDGPDVSDWSFDLELPLFRQYASVNYDIAKQEFDLAENTLSIKRNDLDATLRELLGNYMVAVYRLLNLQNSVLLSTDHVARIRRGYELRDQTRLALLRAQANLKELEARVDLERQRRDTSFREFIDFSGLEQDDMLFTQLDTLLSGEKQTAEVISSFAQVEVSLATIEQYLDTLNDDALLSVYLINSYLYRQLIIERDLSESRADRYTQEEWPELSVQANYGRKEDTRFSDLDSDGSVGLYLSVPIFSGGTLTNNIKTRREAVDLAFEQLHSDNRKTFNRLLNRKKTIISLRNIYQKQKINLLQQEEIVRLSIKSFTIKQTSMQDLLTSKNSLIDAKNLLLKTTMDIGSQVRLFAWELGVPLASPSEAYKQPKQTN